MCPPTAKPQWFVSGFSKPQSKAKECNQRRQIRISPYKEKLLPLKSNVNSPPYKLIPPLDDFCPLYIHLILQALHLKFMNQSVICKLDCKLLKGRHWHFFFLQLIKCLGNYECFRKVCWTQSTGLHQDTV